MSRVSVRFSKASDKLLADISSPGMGDGYSPRVNDALTHLRVVLDDHLAQVDPVLMVVACYAYKGHAPKYSDADSDAFNFELYCFDSEITNILQNDIQAAKLALEAGVKPSELIRSAKGLVPLDQRMVILNCRRYWADAAIQADIGIRYQEVVKSASVSPKQIQEQLTAWQKALEDAGLLA